MKKTIVLCLSGLMFLTCSTRKQEPLKIGFGKVSLTPAAILEDPLAPENKGRGIYALEEKFGISDRVEGLWRPGSGFKRKLADSLYAAAIFGRDKNGPFTIVAADIGGFSKQQVDQIKSAVTQAAGVVPERIVLLASHTHGSPDWDQEKFTALFAKAVISAKSALAPAELACLDIEFPGNEYVINRRVYVPGVGARTVMFNTDCRVEKDHLVVTDHIRQWLKGMGANPDRYMEKGKIYVTNGEVDNRLQAFLFREAGTKRMLGMFVPFAAHAVIVSSKVVNGDVSADYPGHLKRKLESALGGIALFGQGASGNLRPLNREYSHDFAKAYGEKLADLIIRSKDGLVWEPLTALAWHAAPFSLPLREALFLSENEIREKKKQIEKDFDAARDAKTRRTLQDAYWTYYRLAGSQKRLREDWLEKREIETSLRALCCNRAVLLMSPGELFTGLGRAMTEPFSDRPVMLAELADEYVGYYPLKEDYEKGGYEPSVSLVAPGAAQAFVQAARAIQKQEAP